MKHFTIDKENNITFHSSRREAKGADGILFSTGKQFADAIGNDNKRLLEIWNSLPGVKPVARFANRKAATERIWDAIQNLAGFVVAEPSPRRDSGAKKVKTLPTEAPPDDRAMQTAPAIESPVFPELAAGQPNVAPEAKTQLDSAPTAAEPQVIVSAGADVANVAPPPAGATKKATRTKKTPTTEPQAKATGKLSKTDTILRMLTQPTGASLQALMNATGWQAHSVRGFVSGTLSKKMALTVVSAKADSGERRYSIPS